MLRTVYANNFVIFVQKKDTPKSYYYYMAEFRKYALGLLEVAQVKLNLAGKSDF